MLNNILKSFKYSYQQIVTLILIFICLGALAFCVFKVTYTLLTRPIPQAGATKWNGKNQSKPFTPRTTLTKNMFFLTLNDFIPSQNQTHLTEGHQYFIVKTFKEAHKDNAQCTYGIFTLVKKLPHQLNFSVLNYFSGKKFEQYALFTSQNIKYAVLEKEQLPTKILNCKNWVYIDNSYKIKADTPFPKRATVMPFLKPKCTVLPSANLLAVRSDAPNIAYFDYDHIQNKLQMCIKKTGQVFVHMMTLNSAKIQTQYLSIEHKSKSH